MAFSTSAMNSGQGVNVHVENAGETEAIISGQLGFKALNGEKKARIEGAAWPQDNLPHPTASLLSIASKQGLLAAAGPDRLLLCHTQGLRDLVYAAKDDKGQTYEEDVRSYQPFHNVPHLRPAHVAFSSNEEYLIVSEEAAGGLIVYRISDIEGGQTQAASKLSTNGPLRAIAPNPESTVAQFFAAVTTQGDLLVADVSQGQIVSGDRIAQNVSCVSWSNKGKQLVAGLADGSLIQLTQDGTVKAQIPKAPSTEDGLFVSNVAWLENDAFFIAYSGMSSTQSEYYIVDRTTSADKTNIAYSFHKLPELTFPTMDRAPTYQYISRLRNYHPEELKDLLMVACSTSSDIAMVVNPKISIQAQDVQNPVLNSFALVEPDDDGRKAQLPLGDGGDTLPVGTAIDLSDPDGIANPLPTDVETETGIEKSPMPLPLLSVLNNEGVLNTWAVVYNNSVIQNVPFPGISDLNRTKLAAPAQDQDQMDMSARNSFAATPQIESSTAKSATAASPFAAATTSSTPAFGQSGFGSGGAFAKPSSSLGGQASWVSTGFGSNSSQSSSGFGQPAFGSQASLGGNNQPSIGQTGGDTSKPSFGQTGFGQGGAAFGKPGLMGQQTTSTFGQSGFGGQSQSSGSPFASASASTTSGFGAFAGKGGFGGQQTNNSSPFASKPSVGSTFGQPSTQSESPFASGGGNNKPSIFGSNGSASAFSQTSSQSPFGGLKQDSSKSLFGDASSFKVPSSFKGDGTAKDDLPKPTEGVGFGFGGLVNALEKTQSEVPVSPSREEEMADDEDEETHEDNQHEQSKPPLVTPPSTIGQPKATPAPPVSNLFSNNQTTIKTPQTTQASKNTWSSGGFQSTTPKDTPAPTKTLFGTAPTAEPASAEAQNSEPTKTSGDVETPFARNVSPKIKAENEDADLSQIPEAPLPPDPTSKPDYQAGDTSASSLNSTLRESEEPPLPPDFIPANRSAASTLKPEDSELPEEGSELSSDFADSGEDVTHDISSNEEHAEVRSEADDHTDNLRTSPESSFGRATNESPEASLTGGQFTKIIQEDKNQPKKLFGEVGLTGPSFPPPKPQESPRSPSPVRKPPPNNFFRSPDRSVSAPPRPRSVIQDKKQEYQQSALAANAARSRQEEADKEQARQLAEQKAKAEAEARENQALEDDEDELLQQELAKPPEPIQNLDPFMMIQPGTGLETSDRSKPDIPSQIEKLYHDINSMVVTLGINARSLSAFMLYHQNQEPNENWPAVLDSDTPMDALNDEWVLGDISRLHEGQSTLTDILEQLHLHDAAQKLEECHRLLAGDVADLRAKITALRRSTMARTQPEGNSQTPLSAEQLSLQHDLRKVSASVQTKLVQVEEEAAVLRAKLAEIEPAEDSSSRNTFLSVQKSQKKPTVEAVINTVNKMTLMAEKRSSDIDVLEAQLKKLDASLGRSVNGGQPQTPNERKTLPSTTTPKSGVSSTYHTPDSRGYRSTRSTPGRGQMVVVSTEDREKWQAKAKKKQDVAATLKAVLEEKHAKERSGSMTSIKA